MGCGDGGGCEGAESRNYYFGCWLELITVFRIISLVRRDCVNMQLLVAKKKTFKSYKTNT